MITESWPLWCKNNPIAPFAQSVHLKKYLSKLHPICNNLWNLLWRMLMYGIAIHLSVVTKFMYKLSVSCGLSQSYTNHSIHATGATILTECSNFADAQIMSVTGHTSVSSLAIYQRTSDQK
jgi:hypothetical protein